MVEGHDVEERIQRALGRLSMVHSQMQFYLEALIWETLGLRRETGSILTSELSFAALVRAATRIADAAGTGFDFEPFRVRFANADETRNRLLHSRWHFHDASSLAVEILSSGLGADPETAVRVKGARGGNETTQPHRAKEVEAAADELESLASDFTTALIQLIGVDESQARALETFSGLLGPMNQTESVEREDA